MKTYNILIKLILDGAHSDLSVLEMFSDLTEYNTYINNINKIQINDTYEIIHSIKNEIPTDTDMDGYYLVKNEDETIYDIYVKKMIPLKG